MWGMGEHIDRLNLYYSIVCIQLLQVTSLCGRVTGHIDDTLWGSPEDCLDDVRMHACTGWVCDDDVWTTMLGDEIICQDVLHVTSKEQGVVDMIYF